MGKRRIGLFMFAVLTLTLSEYSVAVSVHRRMRGREGGGFMRGREGGGCVRGSGLLGVGVFGVALPHVGIKVKRLPP